MRTTLQLSVATATLMALSCSSGDPTPCEGSESIPQQSVSVGEDKRVMEFCFEDPGGGTLTYSASSADESVVEAFIRGTVFVRGVSPGQTTVTARAVNESDKSASVEFQVLVPNQPPTFIDSVTEATVALNRSIMWNLNEFFEEPDGDEMTFTATSSNERTVGVSVSDSLAEVSGLSDGESQVTLTATDPHGESGTGVVDVMVRVPTTLFEDEFDDERTLSDYTYPDTMEVSVEGGLLRLRYPVEDFVSWAWQAFDEVTDFSIEVTMAPIGGGGSTGVMWYTGLQVRCSGIPIANRRIS